MWTKEELAYLDGRKLSNGIPFKVSGEFHPGGRIELLSHLSRGHSILHIGCADHPELIEQKIQNNTWLHGQLDAVGKLVVGIDNNQEAVDMMKRLGLQNVFACDVTQGLPLECRKMDFDVAILGEVVEHIDDPVGFLTRLRENSNTKIKNLVLTVPNAWSLLNFRYALQGIECINTDHRFWFTPYTISKVLIKSGWLPTRCWLTEPFVVSGSLRKTVRKNFLKKFPLFSETIVVESKLR